VRSARPDVGKVSEVTIMAMQMGWLELVCKRGNLNHELCDRAVSKLDISFGIGGEGSRAKVVHHFNYTTP
jgi:hypothetical protein